ncbi:unnamed protein product [Protopolystoma xenopodis]|uniref:Secreted protein n=1 Tax=Protopolystoma xenopodis TaxID=117903 RepID=A0A448WUM4_9PLAT|nr:unnamed protein product [Protopolystoma xenopodis]
MLMLLRLRLLLMLMMMMMITMTTSSELQAHSRANFGREFGRMSETCLSMGVRPSGEDRSREAI